MRLPQVPLVGNVYSALHAESVWPPATTTPAAAAASSQELQQEQQHWVQNLAPADSRALLLLSSKHLT